MDSTALGIKKAQTRSRLKFWMLCFVVAGLAVVILANIHLVYMAVTSQPDCIPHLKERGVEGTFRAAKSAC